MKAWLQKLRARFVRPVIDGVAKSLREDPDDWCVLSSGLLYTRIEHRGSATIDIVAEVGEGICIKGQGVKIVANFFEKHVLAGAIKSRLTLYRKEQLIREKRDVELYSESICQEVVR